MTVPGGDERLTAHRLMHTLDEMQLLEFFERTIDRDQTQSAVFLSRKVVDLDWCQGAHGGLDGFHHRTPRSGNTIAVVAQLFKPGASRHVEHFLY